MAEIKSTSQYKVIYQTCQQPGDKYGLSEITPALSRSVAIEGERLAPNRRYTFEMHPRWAPSLDEPIVFADMILLRKDLNRFEQRGIYAARVLNASNVGSQKSRSAARTAHKSTPTIR